MYATEVSALPERGQAASICRSPSMTALGAHFSEKEGFRAIPKLRFLECRDWTGGCRLSLSRCVSTSAPQSTPFHANLLLEFGPFHLAALCSVQNDELFDNAPPEYTAAGSCLANLTQNAVYAVNEVSMAPLLVTERAVSGGASTWL